jgi:hypothetical protein
MTPESCIRDVDSGLLEMCNQAFTVETNCAAVRYAVLPATLVQYACRVEVSLARHFGTPFENPGLDEIGKPSIPI